VQYADLEGIRGDMKRLFVRIMLDLDDAFLEFNTQKVVPTPAPAGAPARA